MWSIVYNLIFSINSLTDKEYITLVGHYNNLMIKTSSDEEFLARGYSEEAIKEMRKAQVIKGRDVTSLNLKFKGGDLSKYKFPQFDYIYSLYDKYENHGVLPYSGSHSEQPAKIMEIFSILNSLRIEEDKRQTEKMRKK